MRFPFAGGQAGFIGDQQGVQDGFTPGPHFLFFLENQAQHAHGGMIGQGIGPLQMRLQSLAQRGPHDSVEADDPLQRIVGPQDFIEPGAQLLIGHPVQVQRRFAHFSDPAANRGSVLGIQPEMEGEPRL